MESDTENDAKNRIHVLDEATVNKIAAGEVIERPASVVKELIDNSIDAGASDIRVELKGYLPWHIAVIDNGFGMSRSDATMAFLKHATSKIQTIEDLASVSTMGFRGEALSSIAAVARLEIVTRQKDELTGTKVVVQGSELKGVWDAGTAAGTAAYVEDLFYNTPARRKYLKSERTELVHVIDVVESYALGNTDVSFSLVIDDKVILRAPPSRDLFDRIIHVFGSHIAKLLVPVEFESDWIEISGFISKPELTRSGTDLQSFYINGRSVSSKATSNALRLGYYTRIPKNRYPAAVLKIKVDPKEVDVNVHPTKNQVRLSREREVSEAVTVAVENALKQVLLVPTVERKDTTVQAMLETSTPEIEIEDTIREKPESYRVTPRDTQRRLKRTERGKEEHSHKSATSALDDIMILGQIDCLYIVAETEEGILLIDQHAAHERILYEQVRDSKDSGWQELLIPATLELELKEKVLLEEYIPYLEKFGFAISEFGANTYVVTALPNIFGKLENPDIVHDIISDILSAGRIKDETGVYENVCKTMACRGAIKAGAFCSLQQMENLVRQLKQTENPYTCPHGRPTMVALTRGEIDRMFGRTG